MMVKTQKFLSTLRMAARAAVWKSTPQPAFVGLPALIVCTLAAFIAACGQEYVGAGIGVYFVPYGINAELAMLLVVLTLAALFVPREARTTFLSTLMLLSVAASLVSIAGLLVHWLKHYDPAEITTWSIYAKALGFFFLYLLWWGGAVFALLRSLAAERRFNLWRTFGLTLALILAASAMPYEPVFRGPKFDIRTANYWEYIRASLNGSFARDKMPPPRRVNRVQVELSQPALLEEQISGLTPQVKGKTDIYAIGLAGSADQNVFVSELDGGLKSIARIFPLDGHVLRLANNFDTTATMPVASRQNFAAMVHAVARVMDRDEDILLLFMTSHGSDGGVSLYLPEAFSVSLSPTDVATVLDGEGIKNRIIIVSACYSGVFIKPLANEHTIVLTAADDKHPSFGCSNEREWTYFGDAFFNRNLRPGDNIEDSFRNAKITIAQWEVRDGAQQSNPQGYFGSALMKKLAPLYLKPESAHANLSTRTSD